MDFLEALHARVVPGDGAMGTLLHARGVPLDACLEELSLSEPELIVGIHREYLAAGAQVIRTHSFQANAPRLSRHGLERRVGEINWLAARIAREATAGTNALVAASIGPTGLGSLARAALEDQMGALLDGGAQLVILETFTDLEELLLAVEVKHSLHHCPVVACLAGLKSGDLGEAFEKLWEAGADVVGMNCAGDPRELAKLLPLGDSAHPVAAFPSAGLPIERAGRLVHPVDPQSFATETASLIERGVRFLGGCCGTTPGHIEALTTMLGARAVPTA